MINVSSDGFSSALIDMLKEYGDEVSEVVKKAADDCVKKGKKELQSTSPKRTGKYAKGWKSKVEVGRNGSVESVIYNEKYYMLTHLLEYGHANRNGGTTSAKPHIAPVNDSVQKDFEEKIYDGIEKL